MSRWTEALQNHQIHKTLDELLSQATKEFDNPTDEQFIEKRRFVKVVNKIQNFLAGIDPETAPLNVIDNVNNYLRTEPVLAQAIAYGNTGRAKHLRIANDQISGAFTILASLAPFADDYPKTASTNIVEKEFDSFVTLVNAEKNRLADSISHLSDAVKQQNQRISDLSSEIENRKTEINSVISGWQEQFSSAQNQRQNDFLAAQKDHSKTIQEWQSQTEKEVETSVTNLISKIQEELQEARKNFDEAISEYLQEAKNKHTAILELYGLVAGDSVAAAYVESADNERKAANFWRWASIVFVIATTTWTGLSYYYGESVGAEGNILWTQITKALSITGVLLYGAIYSAKQSNAHRINERQTRWFALEVKAIDPFISSLDNDDRKALKNKLSEKLFGQNSRAIEKDHLYEDQHFLETLLKGIVEIIKAK